MKKLIFLMLLLCSSLAGNAQATFSVRTGFGLEYGLVNSDYDNAPSFLLNVNSNISLKKGSPWIFSPGLSALTLIDEDGLDVYAPLQIGYKSRFGARNYFIPKLGLAFGRSGRGCEHGNMFGPHAELSLELGHFTIGLDGFVSMTSITYGSYDSWIPYGAHLNVGIKF